MLFSYRVYTNDENRRDFKCFLLRICFDLIFTPVFFSNDFMKHCILKVLNIHLTIKELYFLYVNVINPEGI